ncbi:MAG: D-aminoacylase [Calditrichaeota bacterium]|nr:D-aminoacylase [Calditrichota bacterium]
MAKTILLILIFSSLLFLNSCLFPGFRYDLVIKNGCIVDGSGNPWYKADLAVKNDKIVKIGKIDNENARRIIDAKGMIVAPGFIDVHTHADRQIVSSPDAINYIRQGVTTIVGGNCGSSQFPLKETFEQIEKNKISLNFASLAGHNTIRKQVMGSDDRKPTPEEMERMKNLVRREMRSGAVGLSTGLIYLPGRYSDTQEVIELAKMIRPFDGVYATHIRNEGKYIAQALNEAVQIGKKAGVRVEISHIKLANEAVWDSVPLIAETIEQARRDGLEITVDQYPYIATSTGFSSSFPGWAVAGGNDSLAKRMEDPENYQRIKNAVIKTRLTSIKNIYMPEKIFVAENKNHPEYEGKNLSQILKLIGRENTVENAAELIMEMQKEDQPGGVFFKMNEKDVAALMRKPYTMIASDGSIKTIGKGMPHPRSYGTFPRVLSRYVREKSVLSLEDAVRKMTSLPAQTMRFNDRGMLRQGACADVVIFNPEKISDLATFDKPHQYPQGILWVIVNGKIVIDNGKRTDAFPGKIIYGAGKI